MAKAETIVSFEKVSFEYGHNKPILDEPTNHINFRDIPLVAEALNKYQGAMILVSRLPKFVTKIRIDEILDLDK
ncbi:MAG: hypothetical protein A2648_02770 [Candidatus Lloydbacteria bacterium RIFCSPHIGHO2_01_FULL_41_20]|uniref:ABC transporter domain-containing protein n=1 Tax=Candidatus Lloydbacteria bacterium RIFCSPHIGHO2_01_FULL_41_20 TaxID=1798657 RepID=A0A1G2CTM7_9BACT|nr:MAG: hypothetical protein A2648_02770 [Candidatus Lloydbacteria bacterium RIFCSPHIGHO2_01_FULL_41_20]